MKTNNTQGEFNSAKLNYTVKNSKITHRLALGAIRGNLVASCSAGF